MASKTLTSLAKSLDFHSLQQSRAAEYIYNSRINGNHSQSKKMFLALSNIEKKKALEIMREVWQSADILDALLDWYS